MGAFRLLPLALVAVLLNVPASLAQEASPTPRKMIRMTSKQMKVDQQLVRKFTGDGQFYPAGARAKEIGGKAEVTCIVKSRAFERCEILSEDPTGYGFGDAAARFLFSMRILSDVDADGVPIEGGWFTYPMTFKIPR
jgi:hypothetical protein